MLLIILESPSLFRCGQTYHKQQQEMANGGDGTDSAGTSASQNNNENSQNSTNKRTTTRHRPTTSQPNGRANTQQQKQQSVEQKVTGKNSTMGTINGTVPAAHHHRKSLQENDGRKNSELQQLRHRADFGSTGVVGRWPKH